MTYNFISTAGERIKSARMQLRLSRRAFEEKFGIAATTLQAWEDGKYEVPLKGIHRFIEALHKAGVTSTQEWFLNGAGRPPKIVTNIGNSLLPTKQDKDEELLEDEIILREVNFFETLNPSPFIIVISDDAMEPIFSVGDYVGGNMMPASYASNYLGSLCIVKMETGEIVIRKLKSGSQNNLFNLLSINLDSNLENAFIVDCKIDKLAQIVWHRKNERISK